MPGVRGAGGPIPKRSDQLRRRNRKPEADKVEMPEGRAAVSAPAANERWHETARAWYESLANSGQAVFYEPSDWALAYLLAESISRDLKPQVVGVHPETGEATMAVIPMKGASLSAYLKAMTALLVTEGDRRRAQVEIQRSQVGRPEEPRPSGVTKLDEYRNRLSG